MRLNVFLQRAGIGSRREAERLVEQGRIFVNGKKASATTPVEEGDEVSFDGKSVSPAKRDLPRLFLLNKPLDVLVTNRDHKNRATVFELPALLPAIRYHALSNPMDFISTSSVALKDHPLLPLTKREKKARSS